MTSYYISDTHFDHAKIITLCDRPFADVNEMNMKMIENWNYTVRDNDDIVCFLGDFAWKRHEFWFRQLKGKKILIYGNHDQDVVNFDWWKKADYLEVIDGEYKIVLCHYPIAEWNGMFKGCYHFYGHVHTNKMKHMDLNWKARAFNVGVEALDYRPRTAQEIIMAGNT